MKLYDFFFQLHILLYFTFYCISLIRWIKGLQRFFKKHIGQLLIFKKILRINSNIIDRFHGHILTKKKLNKIIARLFVLNSKLIKKIKKVTNGTNRIINYAVELKSELKWFITPFVGQIYHSYWAHLARAS